MLEYYLVVLEPFFWIFIFHKRRRAKEEKGSVRSVGFGLGKVSDHASQLYFGYCFLAFPLVFFVYVELAHLLVECVLSASLVYVSVFVKDILDATLRMLRGATLSLLIPALD